MKALSPSSLPVFRIAVLLLALVMTSASLAQGSWLQKGRDLLRGGSPATTTDLSNQQIAAGLREALRVGSENVVGQLGALNGFNADPQVRIPLPNSLDRVRTALRPLGMAPMLDDLEVRLNRAAEVATPKAKQLFLQSIEAMTLEDVMGIYNGPPDAATRYFQDKMSTPLAAEMRPIVAESLAEVGAVQSYESVMSRYRSLPLAPEVGTDLTGYVVDGFDNLNLTS
ncbi:Protein of unknown function [Geoalkalibacter ferrihydriticus]|uniref:DUF4197 domain-containing protein n=1 Tax=Geoalkalibacter ferrihydriticus TaxID=392333 RepID=A0A1G9XQC6_9BACT|nr:DUF4197 domain-containing protein [Geoalkalibacter ferrihydriticus]SDM98395.1 Protein of unknown function [Geoalkalibacter ferrihydriticus]